MTDKPKSFNKDLPEQPTERHDSQESNSSVSSGEFINVGTGDFEVAPEEDSRSAGRIVNPNQNGYLPEISGEGVGYSVPAGPKRPTNDLSPPEESEDSGEELGYRRSEIFRGLLAPAGEFVKKPRRWVAKKREQKKEVEMPKPPASESEVSLSGPPEIPPVPERSREYDPDFDMDYQIRKKAGEIAKALRGRKEELYKLVKNKDQLEVYIKDKSLLDQIDEERGGGTKRIRVGESWNFLNYDDMVLSPKQWFVSAEDFQNVEHEIYGIRLSGYFAKVTIHTKAGIVSKYLSIEGYLFDRNPDNQELVARVELEPALRFLRDLASEVEVMAGRSKDSEDQQNLQKLQSDMITAKLLSGEWEDVVKTLKELIDQSSINSRARYRLLLKLGGVATAIGKEELVKWGEEYEVIREFDRGLVVKLPNGKYSTVKKGNLLYKNGEAFDEIGPFQKNFAVAKRNDAIGLISKSKGLLVFEVDGGSIFDEKAGFFRVQISQNEWNYVDAERGVFLFPMAVRSATDFGADGKAEIEDEKGVKYYVDVEGNLTRITDDPGTTLFRKIFGRNGGMQKVLHMGEAEIREAIEVRQDRQVEHRLRSVFSRLFTSAAEDPQRAEKLIKTYGAMRKEINDSIAASASPDQVQVAPLRSKLRVLALQAGLGHEECNLLARFSHNLERDLEWEAVGRMPLDPAISFMNLFKKAQGDSSLLTRLDIFLERLVMMIRQNKHGVQKLRQNPELNARLEDLIRESNLGGLTTKARLILSDMRRSEDFYWAEPAGIHTFSLNDQVAMKNRMTRRVHQERQERRYEAVRDKERAEQGRQRRLRDDFETVLQGVQEGDFETAHASYDQILKSRGVQNLNHPQLASLVYSKWVDLDNRLESPSERIGFLERRRLQNQRNRLVYFGLLAFQAAERIEPDNPLVKARLGNLKLVQKMRDEAEVHYLECLNLNPEKQVREIAEYGLEIIKLHKSTQGRLRSRLLLSVVLAGTAALIGVQHCGGENRQSSAVQKSVPAVQVKPDSLQKKKKSVIKTRSKRKRRKK